MTESEMIDYIKEFYRECRYVGMTKNGFYKYFHNITNRAKKIVDNEMENELIQRVAQERSVATPKKQNY